MHQTRTAIQTLGLTAADQISRPAELTVAFQRVCETQLQALYAYVRYRVSNADAAEDLTAKAFLRALERLDTFDPAKGEMTAWIFGIARHLVQDHLRARGRWAWIPISRLAEPESRDRNPELVLAVREGQRHLAAALARLPERERDVLGLKFAAGLTNRQIAGITGLKDSHVGVIVYRAVGRLRQELAKDGRASWMTGRPHKHLKRSSPR